MIALMLAAPLPATTKATKTNYCACTLIVCPVSVMSNWAQQIQTHVQDGVLNVGIYQGANRKDLLPKIQNGSVNVALVSYHTLAAECTKIFGKPQNQKSADSKPPAKRSKSSKSPSIFDFDFRRAILDEGVGFAHRYSLRDCPCRLLLSCIFVAFFTTL